jgi:hypothetical protein
MAITVTGCTISLRKQNRSETLMSDPKLPEMLEKRKLDAQIEASMLDNGRVVISSFEGGRETIFSVFSAEQASNLLDLLSRYRDVLHQLLQQEEEREELPHFEGPYNYPAPLSDDHSQGKRDEDYSWNEAEADIDSDEA